MPSIVARTSTHAFINAAFPFIEEITERGVEMAIQMNPAIANGAQTHRGELHNISRLIPDANTRKP
jgi:alanine dehydrogenase